MPNFMLVSPNARFLLKIDLICLAIMTLDTRGGARGQNLGHLNFFFFFFFKNDILISFQSRTEDLTHNVRAYVLDWVYTSALYTALK